MTEILQTLRNKTTVDIDGTPFEVSPAIIKKTVKIFELRVLIFFQNSEISDDVLEAMFKIQLIIFMIDDYYEQVWNYDRTRSEPFWREITSLILQIGIPSESVNTFLGDLIAYEKTEQQMRAGETPDSINLEYFYLLKSCDVRLQRHLVQYIQSGKICESTNEQIDYDIVGEILDDIDDLEEDRAESIYNGNRLLYCIEKQDLEAIKKYEEYLSRQQVKYENADTFGITELILSTREKLESISLPR